MATIRKDEQIDVRGGHCTYGQMADLGKLLDDMLRRESTNWSELTRGVIRVLHGIDVSINKTNTMYALEVIDAVRHWREMESKLLRYEPSEDERAAGSEALAKLSGYTGVAFAIAERFGVRGGADEVLATWEYASVFMLLYIDLERHKYQKRLQAIRDKKRKREAANKKQR